jgi:hypothetical protein
MQVIFEQQSASLRQILAQIRLDDRLEIRTAPQLVHAEFRSW